MCTLNHDWALSVYCFACWLGNTTVNCQCFLMVSFCGTLYCDKIAWLQDSWMLCLLCMSHYDVTLSGEKPLQFAWCGFSAFSLVLINCSFELYFVRLWLYTEFSWCPDNISTSKKENKTKLLDSFEDLCDAREDICAWLEFLGVAEFNSGNNQMYSCNKIERANCGYCHSHSEPQHKFLIRDRTFAADGYFPPVEY